MRSLTSSSSATLLAFLAVLPSASGAAAPLQEMSASDLKSMGKAMQEYFEELDSPKKLAKAREDLVKGLEKAGKKLVGKSGDTMSAALSLHEDLGKILAASYGYKNMRGGKVETNTIETRAGEIEYALWLPSGYKPSSGPYPLVLLVPDTKQSLVNPGSQFLSEYWTESDLRDNAILAAVTMPEDTAVWGEQFVEDGNGERTEGGISYLMRVFGDVTNQVAFDPDRVYLAGRGAGVPVVMKLGSLFPQLFAGVIGRAGDVGEVTWQNFQNLPTLLLGAGGQATAFEEAAKGGGYDNVTLKPAADAPEVWGWMQEHPRVSNPAKVHLVPGSPIPNRAYWLQVPPMDVQEGTYIKGEVDRATNTITIEGAGVRRVILYFNDVLVDLDQPVKIVLNGQEQSTVIPRSLDTFLNLSVQAANDAGRLYVAVRDFDLPE